MFFAGGEKAIEGQRVFANVGVNAQCRLGSGITEAVEGGQRDEYVLADAGDIDHEAIGIFLENPALEVRDHDRAGR